MNTQVFNNSVATEGEQWSKHTQQFHFIGADSVLLPGKIWCGSRQVQLFIQALPANGKVCVCVWQTATRHLREKKTTTAQIWNLFWVTEEELNLRQRECVSEQTFVSCLWSNCRNPNSFDIDWGLVLSNETPCKRKTETSSLLSFVKTGSAIYFRD